MAHVRTDTYSRPALIRAERGTVIRRPAVSYVRDWHGTAVQAARASDGFPPFPVEWALGCFVRFQEVDRGTPVTAMGQVTSFGSRSVNGSNGAEATDQDFVVCVRFPVCGDQKQTVGFRPNSVTPDRMDE
jgi:hypothetical protein